MHQKYKSNSTAKKCGQNRRFWILRSKITEKPLRKGLLFFIALAAIGGGVFPILIGLHFLFVPLIGLAMGISQYFVLRYRGRFLASKIWLCPKCGQNFQIHDWQEVAIVVANLNTCKVRCTHCGVKSFCYWQ